MDILNLLKRIERTVKQIKPFDVNQSGANAERKAEVAGLLHLALDKVESGRQLPTNHQEDLLAKLEQQQSINFEYCGKVVEVKPGTTLAELQKRYGYDLDILDIFRADWKATKKN